jgi:hypothetical protein
MSDDPISACQVCGAPVERVFHPVAVHFKGSGFYSTDYGKKRTGAAAGAESSSDSGNGTKTDSSKTDSAKSGSGDSAKKSDTKTASGD